MLVLINPQNADNEIVLKSQFKELREKVGLTCKKCGCSKHYWIASRWQWQCAQCRFRTTLRSGTVLQNSHLSFCKWYQCMNLLARFKDGVSAKQMQRELGHSRYRTVWYMLQRIRAVMGKEEFWIYNQLRKGAEQPAEKTFKIENHKLRLNDKIIDFKRFQKSSLKRPRKVVLHSRGAKCKQRDRTFYLSQEKRQRESMSKCYKIDFFTKSATEQANNRIVMDFENRNNFEELMTIVHRKINLNYLQNYLDEYTYRTNRKEDFSFNFEQLWLTAVHFRY